MKISELALNIAAKAHQGQKDLALKDYIEHSKAVANSLNTDEEKAIGYLHDVLEDTSLTENDLISMGVPKDIVNVVKILTKDKSESYTDYIKRVNNNELARKVKIADLKHNMDLSRIPNLNERDYKRLEKYKKALCYLES